MLKAILSALNSGRNLLISGGAGVGKTHLLSRIAASVKKSQILAPTAIAAVNVGGRTVHSFFRFRLAQHINELKITSAQQSDLIADLEALDLLIIDEISMLSAGVFEMIDHFLCLCKQPPTLLLVGDFYQLAPISRGAAAAYAFNSPRWAAYDFALIELRTQHRMDSPDFCAALNCLRVGQTSAQTVEFFARFIQPLDVAQIATHTVICGTNAEADFINSTQLARLNGQLLSTRAQINYSHKPPPARLLREMFALTPVAEQLDFKLGCRVLVTMNNAAAGVYNGMQARIVEADLAAPTLTLEVASGKKIKLSPMDFYFDQSGALVGAEAEPAYGISGFALKLAYAITIHKSQGMSIERLVCKCDRIFAAGQLYVAFSRASSAANFKIAYAGSRAAFSKMLVAKTRANAEVAAFYANCKRFGEEARAKDATVAAGVTGAGVAGAGVAGADKLPAVADKLPAANLLTNAAFLSKSTSSSKTAPAASQPAAQKPAAQKSAAQKSSQQSPAAQLPAVQLPAAQKSVAQLPAVQKSVAQKSASRPAKAAKQPKQNAARSARQAEQNAARSARQAEIAALLAEIDAQSLDFLINPHAHK